MRSALRGKFYMLFMVLLSIASSVSAQTVTWSESYQQWTAPTAEQRQNWTAFLASLSGKKFASVTLSGSFDGIGKTLSDPVAATQLADLLATGTPGVVRANGQAWVVTNCDTGNGVLAVALSVDGNETACACSDTYALRPHSTNGDWGGVNSPGGTSCGATSQSIKLEFHSGVRIVADGPTEICEGGTVVLKAVADVCSAPLTYAWSNGETTESIVVSKPGTFTVTVSDGLGCNATSSPVDITNTTVSVSAGADALYCDQPVQLNAVGSSIGGKSSTTVQKICLFDAAGGAGNCEYLAGNICLEGQREFKETTSFSTTTSVTNPVELRYVVYYTAWYPSTFNFKLNGQTVKSYTDSAPDGECDTAVPMAFVVSQAELKPFWNESASNTLEIEVVGGVRFDVAGLAVEIVTSNDSYSWTPSEGLDFANISNPKASPLVTTDYTVTYTDANGCKAFDQVRVTVQCGDVAPIAECKPVEVTLTDNCLASVAASDFDNGSSSPSGLPLTYSIAPAGPFAVGTTRVTLTVTDSNNNSSSCTTTITVIDATLPVIPQPAELIVANDPGLCTATLVLPLPEASDNCGMASIVSDQEDNVFPVGTTTVTWTVKDVNGNSQTATQLVTVTNAAPVISAVVGPTDPVAVGRSAVLSITYEDDNISQATIDWADGSTPTVLNEPVLSFEASHTYTSTGTYAVSIVLTDKCGAATSTVYESIVVFDPRSGSVKGGGWFESPAGAYVENPTAVGRASFSFDASYDGFSNIPQGSSSFTFRAADLKFKSSQFELLLIDGETARLTGTGTVNGRAGHDILIAMVDDDTKLPRDKSKKQMKADRIRVRITDPSGAVIYDTQLGQSDDAIASTHINSGSIEIGNNNTFSTTETDMTALSSGEESTSVYPNPFIDYMNVQFATTSTQDIVITVMDLAGQVIARSTFPVSADGIYTIDVPESASEGIYVLTIRQGKRVETFTVIKN